MESNETEGDPQALNIYGDGITAPSVKPSGSVVWEVLGLSSTEGHRV